MDRTHSFVVKDCRALFYRAKLDLRLAGRPDITRPEIVPNHVAKAISSHLVAGLDYLAEPGSGGWPLPTGGRHAKLCFSSLMDTPRKIDGAKVLSLPTTSAELADYYAETVGLDVAGWSRLFDLFRVDLALVETIRDIAVGSDHAWTLLMSHEFGLAQAACPQLGERVEGSGWLRPAIHAFKLLAEIERLVLTTRRLARTDRLVDLEWLIPALTIPSPLCYPEAAVSREYHRFFEYLLFDSVALETFLSSPHELKDYLPSGFPLSELAAGRLPVYNPAIFDDMFVRHYLIDELTTHKARGRGRPSQLARASAGTFWGISSAHLIAVGVHDLLARFGRSSRTPLSDAPPFLERRTALVRQLLLFADPAAHAKIEDRALSARPDWEYTWTTAAKLAKLRLPRAGRSGSAARFDPLLWNAKDRDVHFWTLLLDPDLKKLGAKGLPQLQSRMRTALIRLRVTFRKLYPQVTIRSELGPQVVAVMATSVSAMTMGRSIPSAIRKLLQDARLQKLLGLREPSRHFCASKMTKRRKRRNGS